MTTVITAVYGGYEHTLPDLTSQTAPVDRKILVTDALPGDLIHGLAGWEVVFEPRPHLHPNVAAKIPKFVPWNYADDRDDVVWMDANTIAGPKLVELAVAAADVNGFAQFPHPVRDCIYDEAAASRGAPGLAKYDGQMLEQQVGHYRQLGMPAHFGLWATGVIGYRPSQYQTWFGRDWLLEVYRWTMQDQLSQPYVFWKHNVRPAPIARDLWCDPELVWFRGHGT